jgi:hypothetical protein
MMTRGAKRLIKGLFNGLGVTVERRDDLVEAIPPVYRQSPFLPAIYRRSLGRILHFKEMLERVAGVDGDLVECGVSIGHGLLLFLLLGELIAVNRRVYGFDSFEGFPECTVPDTRTDGSFYVQQGDYRTSIPMVERVLRDGQVSDEVIDGHLRLVKGFFDQTLPLYEGRIALLHLDCDLYESYRVCLAHLYDRVVPGGIIMFDEYEDHNFPGARRAVDEFFADKGQSIQEYSRYQYRKYYVVKA